MFEVNTHSNTSRGPIRKVALKNNYTTGNQYITTIKDAVKQFAANNYTSKLNNLLARSATKDGREGATSQEQYQIAIVTAISDSALDTSLKIDALTALKDDSRTNPSTNSQTTKTKTARAECEKAIKKLNEERQLAADRQQKEVQRQKEEEKKNNQPTNQLIITI